MSRDVPIIVKGLWDAFDMCDPTRSHEMKPSERWVEARLRRRMRAAVILCASVAAIVIWLVI
jgi:hypothetical protein